MVIKGEIDPEDLREFYLDMKGIDPDVLFKDEWLPFIKGVAVETGKYPRDFPGNTYVRTGNLGRNWMYAVLNSTSAEVSNAATYAGYVHGEKQQVWHGIHGWKRLLDVGEDRLEKFIKKMKDKVGRIWTS